SRERRRQCSPWSQMRARPPSRSSTTARISSCVSFSSSTISTSRPPSTASIGNVGSAPRATVSAGAAAGRRADVKPPARAPTSPPGAPEAAVQLDEPPYDRQTEARAAMTATHRRLDLIEGIPDACQLLLRDPDAVVLHRHPHLIALAAGQHAHLAAGRAEFH